MSIAAHALGEAALSAQPPVATTEMKPPKRRQTVAKGDVSLIPEAR